MLKEAKNRGRNSRKNDCRTQKSLKDTVLAAEQASRVVGDARRRQVTLPEVGPLAPMHASARGGQLLKQGWHVSCMR